MTRLNEIMSIEEATARLLAGDCYQKHFNRWTQNLTAIIVPGSLDGPRSGAYALMIGSLWLSMLCPRAWAAWVLDKEAEFALTKEEIEQWKPG